MSIKWRDGLATGLEWQDEQHKQLFEQMNTLIEAMQRNDGASVIKEMIAFLRDYAQHHLVEEEQFMELHNDPSLVKHRRAHDTFRENLTKLDALYERQGASTLAVFHAQRWLRDWLLKHIAAMDRELRAIEP